MTSQTQSDGVPAIGAIVMANGDACHLALKLAALSEVTDRHNDPMGAPEEEAQLATQGS